MQILFYVSKVAKRILFLILGEYDRRRPYFPELSKTTFTRLLLLPIGDIIIA